MESSNPLLSGSSPSSQSLSLSPSMTVMDNLRETPQPQYLKLEDLQSAASPSISTSATLATVVIHSKPAKKRKSWGQTLPEPTTNLPPRKRAKTAAEKEQRRFERIKRNRAAAHNSRERKRQETETLAVLLARARAELDAYRRLHGPLPADVVLPEVTLSNDPYAMAQGLTHISADSPDSESPGTVQYASDASTCLPSPATSLLDSNSVSIKQEPFDNTVSPMAMFEELDSKPSPLPTLDVTQHSAVSVEPQECEDKNSNTHGAACSAAAGSAQPNLEQTIFDLPSLSRMVGEAVSLSYPSPHSDCLPTDTLGNLDHFAFANAGFDQAGHHDGSHDNVNNSGFHEDSFGNDAFFFDDLIDTDAVAAFAVDPVTGAAA